MCVLSHFSSLQDQTRPLTHLLTDFVLSHCTRTHTNTGAPPSTRVSSTCRRRSLKSSFWCKIATTSERAKASGPVVLSQIFLPPFSTTPLSRMFLICSRSFSLSSSSFCCHLRVLFRALSVGFKVERMKESLSPHTLSWAAFPAIPDPVVVHTPFFRFTREEYRLPQLLLILRALFTGTTKMRLSSSSSMSLLTRNRPHVVLVPVPDFRSSGGRTHSHTDIHARTNGRKREKNEDCSRPTTNVCALLWE